MEKLTNENYYSQESNMEYMSVSSFKDFQKCEVQAMDKLLGLVEEEKSDALIFGGYIDAYFSGELDQYIEENRDRLFLKNGNLKAPFQNVNEVIKTIEDDPFFLSFHKGETQRIYTGVINGVKVKGKFDFDFIDKIVDQKVMKDFAKIWVEDKDTGRNVKTDFIEAYGYHIQGGVYQELRKQKIGDKVPFIIAATTKEECPDKALIQIDQEYLDKGLQEFSELAPRYDLIKKGLLEPVGCGKCPSCRRRKKLTNVVLYSQFFNKESEGNNEEENAN